MKKRPFKMFLISLMVRKRMKNIMKEIIKKIIKGIIKKEG